ncbi:hypothetical protein AVEN_232610-1 [Araneus ventricosus]|uniref:Uncharacterized protein n=1 Tax=Araneus ventricosus TaxID=182803 RepID=A0A4Y2S4C0_ARAVE|nr:hypothetical protein AVEN_232610-1 [Araneus ventricosus]
MNTAKCSSTGQTAAFLTFGRELRTVDEVQNDLRSVTFKDTFVSEITPYLKGFSKFMAEAKEVAEMMKSDATRFADRASAAILPSYIFDFADQDGPPGPWYFYRPPPSNLTLKSDRNTLMFCHHGQGVVRISGGHQKII